MMETDVRDAEKALERKPFHEPFRKFQGDHGDDLDESISMT
jgi:hypothetical protein